MSLKDDWVAGQKVQPGDYNALNAQVNANTAALAEGGAGGDMLAATYDPTSIAADAFDQDNMVDGITNKNFTAAEQSKLSGVQPDATANDTDANLLNRANHTGTQAASTISDFNTAADARISAAAGVTVPDLVGGVVPTSQIPALALTTVQTAASEVAMLALTTEQGDVVVRSDESATYIRNAGTAGTMADFTLLPNPGGSGGVTSVNSQTGIVVLGPADIGLGNVNNTADVNKPVSTAQQTALDLKAPKANPTFTGTVSGVTKAHVGLGNADNTSDTNKPVSTATQSALDLKAPKDNPTFTGTVSGVTKAHVGLGAADNTADIDKPLSAAMETALDSKLDESLAPVQITQAAYDALGPGRPARLYAIVG